MGNERERARGGGGVREREREQRTRRIVNETSVNAGLPREGTAPYRSDLAALGNNYAKYTCSES